MKYIEDAEPLTVQGQQIGTAEIIRWLLDNAAHFNSDGRGIRAAVRIERALTERHPSGAIALDDPDATLLAAAAENPGQPYLLKPARALLPHIDRITQPTDQAPTLADKAAE